MRHRRTRHPVVVVAALCALVLSACGDDDSGTDTGDTAGAGGTPAGAEEPENVPIEGTRWLVDGTVADATTSPIPADVMASITITDGTASVESGCNTGSGAVEVTDDTLTFGPIAITLRACEPAVSEVENAVIGTLVGEVAYEIEGDRLSMRRDTGDGEVGLELIADG